MLLQAQLGRQDNQSSGIATLRAGRQGDLITGGLHGKYFEATRNGQVYTASTVIAGVVIPVAAATLNSKFTFWNPAGSGVVCELISVYMCGNSATTVAGTHGLMIQRNLIGTSGIPTSVGTLAVSAQTSGAGASSATTIVAAQATCTNAAIPGVNAAVSIPYWPLGGYGAVTAVGAWDLSHRFDGELTVGPDSLVAACTTVAASTAAFIQICWAEYQL